VRRLLEAEDMPVIIQTDQNASAGVLMRVIDESKMAGAKVSLSAEKLN
jgi:hypothetical protein